MFIEKSSYHPINKKVHLNRNIVDQNLDSQKENIFQGESFNFLKWMKGLVNPLQNLPIISGIYSSINSNEKDSDRDLVQNSLGGFLYGGPFGAIAGMGNWVFNKVFDQTPTELFFKVTGISKFWKDDVVSSSKVANKSENFESIENVKNKSIQKNLVNLENQNLVTNIKKSESSKSKIEITNNILKEEKKNLNNQKNGKGIEFLYPKWKPREDLNIKKNSKNLNLSMINKLYKNDDLNISNKLNTKA